MSIGTGWGAALALAEQVDFDTPIVAPTNILKVVSVGVKKTIEKVPVPHLGCVGATSRVRRSHFTARENAGGTVEIVASYDDSTVMLMKHALGAVATIGAGPYVHTVSLAADAPLPLTAWQLNGDNGGNERFTGTYVNQWEFKVAAGDVARLVIGDFIAKEGAGLAEINPVLPTEPTSEPILHSHVGVVSYNGNNYTLVSLSVKGDRKLARRQLLGSTKTKQPLPSDFYEVSGTLTIELDPTDALDGEWSADTTADMGIPFVGIGNNALTVNLDNVYVNDISAPVSAAGVIQRTITFTAQAGAAGEGVEFLFANDNATAEANG